MKSTTNFPIAPIHKTTLSFFINPSAPRQKLSADLQFSIGYEADAEGGKNPKRAVIIAVGPNALQHLKKVVSVEHQQPAEVVLVLNNEGKTTSHGMSYRQFNAQMDRFGIHRVFDVQFATKWLEWSEVMADLKHLMDADPRPDDPKNHEVAEVTLIYITQGVIVTLDKPTNKHRELGDVRVICLRLARTYDRAMLKYLILSGGGISKHQLGK